MQNSPIIGRNARFAAIGNGLTAGVMGIAGVYLLAVLAFLVAVVLTLPVLPSLFQIGRGRAEPAALPSLCRRTGSFRTIRESLGKA